MPDADHFLTQAITLARDNVRKGGRPFGAVLVIDGEVVATGVNGVIETQDPTAHAELVAVRAGSDQARYGDAQGGFSLCQRPSLPDVPRRHAAGRHYRHCLCLFQRRRRPLLG